MIRRTALAFAIAAASFTTVFSSAAFAADDAKKPEAAAPQAATPTVDLAKGQQIGTGVCAGCHMPDGNSVIPVNPILAGQISDYLFKQLKNFKLADGKPPVRSNPVMMAMTMPLSEDDMRNVAAYFASQTMKPAASKDEAAAAAGKKIWRGGDLTKGIPACAGCHGTAGAGLPAQFPRLAGQNPEYTEIQLKAFRAGERANDAERVMRMIAAKMSDAEIKAVAEYAASLR